jgi:hypothetical protein
LPSSSPPPSSSAAASAGTPEGAGGVSGSLVQDVRVGGGVTPSISSISGSGEVAGVVSGVELGSGPLLLFPDTSALLAMLGVPGVSQKTSFTLSMLQVRGEGSGGWSDATANAHREVWPSSLWRSE